jgi:hypothetical protein
MELQKAIYAYLIYIAALWASIWITVFLGLTVFELGVLATLLLNAAFGILTFSLGLGCLALANAYFKPADMMNPPSHFFLWAFVAGTVQGMSFAISVPVINGINPAIAFALNGSIFRAVFPALLTVAIYIGIKLIRGAKKI